MAARYGRRRRSRLGVLGGVGLAALALILAASLVLERQLNPSDLGDFVEYVRQNAVPPESLLVTAARQQRILLVSDIPGNAEPKRVVANAIEAIVANGPGLDAVLLDVDQDLQPLIDRYINSPVEETSILLDNPALLGDQRAGSRGLLDIYRRVRALNDRLGPARRIRIVAIGLPGSATGGPLAPRRAVERLRQLDRHMADVVEQELDRTPRARLLAFVDGYHVLKGGAELQIGGGDRIEVTWLGGLLQQARPGEAFSAIMDAYPPPGGYTPVGTYSGTAFFDVLRRNAPNLPAPIAVPAGAPFRFLRAPVRENTGPGLSLELQPERYRLGDVADAYIYLGARR